MSELFPHNKTAEKVAFAPKPVASKMDEIEQHIRLALDLARQKPGYERALTSAQDALQALQTARHLPSTARKD